MPLDSKQKLALYRKLESDVSAGVLLALDIFNEECGKLVEEKKQEMEDILAKMDKEIRARELKDGVTPTKQELLDLIAPQMQTAIGQAVREAGKKMEAIQRDMVASVKHGNDGVTPKAGKDYPTIQQLQDFVVKKMLSMKPADGLTPSEEYLTALIAKQAAKITPVNIQAEIEKGIKAYLEHPSFMLGAEKIRNLPRAKGTKGKYHAAHGGGSSTSSTFYTDTVSGTINGSNKIFTVPNTITSAQVLLLAGIPYQPGVDFNTSGSTITFVTAPDASLAGQPFWLLHT